MTPIPFERNLRERALALGLHTITLNFSGGNDEGFLEVSLLQKNGEPLSSQYPGDPAGCLAAEIQDWAWDHYPFHGTGIGVPYGDILQYNLTEDTIEYDSWYETPHPCPPRLKITLSKTPKKNCSEQSTPTPTSPITE